MEIAFYIVCIFAFYLIWKVDRKSVDYIGILHENSLLKIEIEHLKRQLEKKD
jgi:hypothetical protein